MTKKWMPLQEAVIEPGQHSDTIIRRVMQVYNLDYDKARELLEKDEAKCRYWRNDIYQVEMRPVAGNEHFVQLNVRRLDGEPIRDWRHLQQIKNELVGPECEAIEIYPAESRLVDTSNKYHLWACTDPTFRFSIGFQERDVKYEYSKVPGLRQRPFDKSMKVKK